MADIKLTPEMLIQQSSQLSSLRSEYESLFRQVTSTLNGMNDSWSDNLAGNFSGKIQTAQTKFSSIQNMLENGASAAMLCGNSFENISIGAALSSLMGDHLADAPSGLAQWIQQNASSLGTANKSGYLAALMNMAGLDGKAVTKAIDQIGSGDFKGALQTAGDKIIDTVANWMNIGNGVEGTFLEGLDKLEKATGGVGLVSRVKQAQTDYWKNLATSAISGGKSVISADNPGDQLKELGKMAWNIGPGSVIEAAGNQVIDFVKEELPSTWSWWAERGASDLTSTVGVGLGSIHEMITGDTQAAQEISSYYSDHGGIAAGIVDGVVNIGSYLFSSVFNK